MKKLSLNKEVIAQLNDDSMNKVKGGLDTEYCSHTLAIESCAQSICFCVASRELSNCPLCNQA